MARVARPLCEVRSTPHYLGMHSFLTVLIVILMLATLGVLIAGMVGMVRETDPRRSNKLMQWRVLLQGATILLFVILMSLLRS
jgi:Hypoxia induced protein conserved region